MQIKLRSYLLNCECLGEECYKIIFLQRNVNYNLCLHGTACNSQNYLTGKKKFCPEFIFIYMMENEIWKCIYSHKSFMKP